MKTKRYFKLILKPYNVILKNFDEDIRISIGTKFCCFPQLEEKEIEIPIFEDKKGRKAFYEKMQRRLKEYKINGEFSSEILSFLHEIGHIYTYEEQNEEEYTRDTELLSLLFKEKKLSAKQLNEFYVRLPLETNATKWAIDFAMQNKKFCKYYQNKIGKEISK